jgi:hypothetical protein
MDLPSDPFEQRRRLYRQLRAGCIGLVGASCGLIALYAGATPGRILAAVAAGLVVGVVLVAVVFPDSDAIEPSRTRRGR